jgi:probable HAF family extracellular repeat protein
MLDLGALEGGAASWGEGVNRHGVVVGYAANAAGWWRAFRWTETTGMIELPALSDEGNAMAFDVNDDGLIAGTADDAEGKVHVVLWHPDGSIEDLGSIGDQNTLRVFAISNDGVVVGDFGAMRKDRGEVVFMNNAFRWTRSSGFMRMGSPNENSTAVDVSLAGAVGMAEDFACVWKVAGCHPVTRLDGYIQLAAVNDLGDVAGYVIDPNTGRSTAVLWTRKAVEATR